YLDGDYKDDNYSNFHKPTGTSMKWLGTNANNKNLVAIAVESPSAATSADGKTWWKNGTRNARWLQVFAQDMQEKYDLKADYTYVAGYSGGAELITMYLMPY